MEEAAECALEHLPGAFGELLVLGLVMVVISALITVGGVALVIVGVARRRRSGRAWVPPVLSAAGTALVVPALWLLVSFVGAVGF